MQFIIFIYICFFVTPFISITNKVKKQKSFPLKASSKVSMITLKLCSLHVPLLPICLYCLSIHLSVLSNKHFQKISNSSVCN